MGINMTRTECDKCGNNCMNYVARFYGNVSHKTADGEEVGEDNIKSREFCYDCAQVLMEAYGFKTYVHPGPEPEMPLNEFQFQMPTMVQE